MKKYIVRLSQEERAELRTVIKKLVGASQKVRRAQILLKADADGPYWTDSKIADAYGCLSKTVGNLRQSLVNEGFHTALNGKKLAGAPIPKNPISIGKPVSSPLVSDPLREVLPTGACDCRPASVFMFCEPLAGWREASVRERQTKIDWA